MPIVKDLTEYKNVWVFAEQRQGKIMKVVTLASGSKGNCTYLETTEAKILIDAGITVKQIELRLNLIGVKPDEIDAILITHEHSDHIKGVGLFARKHKTDVYAHNYLFSVIQNKTGLTTNEGLKFFESDFFIKDLTISSFEVPHDATHCVGYNFLNEGKKISIATDLGHTNSRIIEQLKDSTLVILEANYEEELLVANSKYPPYLKNRIRGSRGHLSNLQAVDVIAELVNYNVKQIVLAHLSEENNAPEVAFNSIKKGYIDIPFSPHIINANEVITIRDPESNIRILKKGNLPISDRSFAFEQSKIKLAEGERVVDKIIKDIGIML